MAIWPSDWRPPPGNRRVIVCAAIRMPDGYILAGPRHCDATMHQQRRPGDDLASIGAIEGHGFLDQYGCFLTREEAWPIAEAAGQIWRRCGGDEGRLFSENLY